MYITRITSASGIITLTHPGCDVFHVEARHQGATLKCPFCGEDMDTAKVTE